MSRRNVLRRRPRLAVVLSGAIIAVLLLAPLPAFAATVLADGYSEAYRQDELDVAVWGPTGQTFLSGASGTLDSCQFMLYRVGPVAGDVYAQLWAHTGTFGTNGTPTGLPLATSSAVDVTTISDSWQTVTFTFDNSVALTSGTPYVITVDYPTGGTGTLFVGLDWGGFMLHPGRGIYTWPAGTWNVGEAEVIFAVYATQPDPDTAGPVIDASVAEGGSYVAPVAVSFSANDAAEGPVGATATLNGDSFTSGSSISTPGSYTLVITASDSIPNTSVSTIDFTVTPPPAPPVVSTPASSVWGNSLLALCGVGLAIAQIRRRPTA